MLLAAGTSQPQNSDQRKTLPAVVLNQIQTIAQPEIKSEPLELNEGSCIADHEMTDESGIESSMDPFRQNEYRQQSFQVFDKNEYFVIHL